MRLIYLFGFGELPLGNLYSFTQNKFLAVMVYPIGGWVEMMSLG
jgi:hypothetical protein